MVHLFIDSSAIGPLGKGTFHPDSTERKNWTVDIVSIPATHVVEFDPLSETYSVKEYIRDDQGNWKTHERNVTITDASIEDADDTKGLLDMARDDSTEQKAIVLSFLMARQAENYLSEIGFWDTNEEPDDNTGGIYLTGDGEELQAKVVYGEDRPDMMCIPFRVHYKGGQPVLEPEEPEMSRPYKEDFMKRLMAKTLDRSASEPAKEEKAAECEPKEDPLSKKSKENTPGKLNFFCDIDTLNYLAGLDYPKDHAVVDLSVDFIEAPFWFIFTDEEESWKLRTIRRGELYSHDEGMGIDLGTLNVSKETNEGSGTTSDQMLSQNMGVFFKAIRNLSYYAQEHGLVDKLGPLDSEESGVMLGTDGKKLTYKIVSGKERPDLMCATLFGGTVMMRPYMDDFWERSEGDFMSLEEKIEAAEGGNEYIMEQLALAYLNGDEDSDEPIEPDPEKAVYWFTKLAELDHSDAQFNLGLHCAKGFGIERSFEKAVYWLKRAEENGDEDAPGLMEKLQKAVEAEKLLSAAEPQSPALAFEEALTFAQQDSFEQLIRTTNIQKLVSTGKSRSQAKSHAKFRAQTPEQAQALADLAAAHMFLAKSMDQAGPGKDFELAFDYARQAAALDNGDGIWALALCYEHGRGVDKEVNKAINLYRRGAELGHAPSQHSLACYYFRGDVLKKDDKTAFELCMKSAQQGYGLAMADVGRCYQFGNGVMGNMKTAVEWYEKSLEVLPDPELERKTAMFKMMSEGDEHWDEDYPGVDEEDFDDIGDDDDSPSGYMAAMEAFIAAEEYETELADQGLLPDAPRPGNGAMTLSARGFPRIALRAEEGDARAQAIMEQMKAANEMD